MDEGTSEATQNVDVAVEPLNNSAASAVSSEGDTPQNDAVMDDSLTQTALTEGFPAADEKTMELVSNTGIIEDSSKDAEQEARLDGEELAVEHASHQIEADKMEDQLTETVVATAVKTAEGDGFLSASKIASLEQISEKIGIQDDDLIKAVLDALEARRLLETRPIPVLLKGREVDLVQLSLHVRAIGGYDQVTLWSAISKSLGFGQNCGPLLKLVYVKYLKSTENWRSIAGKGIQGLQNGSEMKNTESAKRELFKNQSNNRAITSERAKCELFKNQPKNRAIASTRKTGTGDAATIINNPGAGNSVVHLSDGSQSLAQVLEWMKRLALNPGDPRKGQGARVSRWREAWVEKCETLAARLREVLWKKPESSVYDFPLSQGQDEDLERKRGGRGPSTRIGKKARHASS